MRFSRFKRLNARTCLRIAFSRDDANNCLPASNRVFISLPSVGKIMSTTREQDLAVAFSKKSDLLVEFFIGKGFPEDQAIDLAAETVAKACAALVGRTLPHPERENSWLVRVASSLLKDVQRQQK
jgi:hypothetical protein